MLTSSPSDDVLAQRNLAMRTSPSSPLDPWTNNIPAVLLFAQKEDPRNIIRALCR